MAVENAARLFKAVQQAESSEQRQSAISDPERFLVLAEASGYSFTAQDLPAQLSRLSDEQVAAIFNPGVGPRRHLTRR
jgi:predicted ribosomally synthesized peptide with nif11-like leader